MKKLSVLALVQLPPPVHGAGLRNKEFVESEYVKEDCDISFVEIQTSTALEEIGSFHLRKLLLLSKIFICVLYKLIFKRPDVVYITLSAKGFALYKDTFLIAVAHLFRIPVVCHMRNRGLDDSIKESKFSKVLTAILSKCQYIVMSRGLASDISMVCKTPAVISNCLTWPPKNLDESDMRRRLDTPKVIFISNVCEAKGAIIFLKTAKELDKYRLNNHANIDFHVYGPFASEEEEEKFNKCLKSLDLKNIYIHGPVYGEEKLKALDESSLMLFPTNYEKECFPGVIMEAFRFGIPVVGGSVAAVPEMISNGVNGYVIHGGDVKRYAQAVVSVLDGDKYFNFSHQALSAYNNNMRHASIHPRIVQYLKQAAAFCDR